MRSKRAQERAGESQAKRPGSSDTRHKIRATGAPAGHQTSEESLLEQLPRKRHQRRCVDGGKIHDPTAGRQRQTVISADRTAITHKDKERMILESAFPEPPPDNDIRAPQGGSADTASTNH